MDAALVKKLTGLFRDLTLGKDLDVPTRYDDLIVKQLTDSDKASLIKTFNAVVTEDVDLWLQYHCRMLTLRLMWVNSHQSLVLAETAPTASRRPSNNFSRRGVTAAAVVLGTTLTRVQVRILSPGPTTYSMAGEWNRITTSVS
jgi:hypothetical protein